MLRFAPWKLASVLALVAAAILLVVPSFLSSAFVEALAARVPSFVPLRQIVLGLDLQGGAYMLMQVDDASVVKAQVEALRDDVRQKMRDGKIALSGGIVTQARGVLVRIADPAERDRAYALLQSLSQPIGGALAGGNGRTLDVTETDSGVQMTLTDAAIADKVRHAVTQSIEVLNRRVNAMGTKETVIAQQGLNRVLIEIPGLQDTTKLKEIIGQTAKLDFQLAADPGDPPNEVESLPMEKGGGTITVQKRVMVDGADLVDAQQSFDQQTGEPDVTFKFNLRGGQRFGRVTTESVGRPFAIVLDGKVISAPVIRSPITGGTGQITGNFTIDEASNLAILLRSGALPAKLTVVEERTVGPGLGQDSIDAGKRAAYVGGGARRGLHDRDLRDLRRLRRPRAGGAHPVHLRLDDASRGDADPAGHRRHRVHHRHGGRFQRAHLRAHPRGGASRPFGHLRPRRRLQARLRHHRRLQRDDVRRGAHPLPLRLGRGPRLRRLARPRDHHLDHHRGDDDPDDDRPLVPPRAADQDTDLKRRSGTSPMKHLRLAPENTKFGFMRFRRVSYPLSAALSIVSVLMFLFVGMNFGIDFAGGTQVDIRAKDGEARFGGYPRQGREPGPRAGRGAADRFGRRRPPAPERAAGGEQGQQTAIAKLRDAFERDFEFRSVDSVGPSVSAELVQSGTLGVVVAIIAVLTYLWFRFEWQFAVGAIIGTMHDLLLTVGFFCVTQLEFNQTSIAAILTIVGYSLNETVVVLDRIREVMRKYKRLSTAEIIDKSINAVLPRTIMTATTVFLALLALFFLGGHVIRSFSAAMIWGIFVATYSSIFICSPMLIYMGVRADVFDKKDEEAGRRR